MFKRIISSLYTYPKISMSDHDYPDDMHNEPISCVHQLCLIIVMSGVKNWRNGLIIEY